MRAFGQVEVTTVTLPNEVLFVATRRGGWTDYFAIPLLVAIVVWLWIDHKELMSVIFAAVGGYGLLSSWAKGPETRLTITNEFLLADGNLNRMMTDEIRLPIAEVKWIKWDSGGQHGMSGLHVGRGLTRTCVFPGVSKKQCASIREEIGKQFPDLVKRDGAEFSLTGNFTIG